MKIIYLLLLFLIGCNVGATEKVYTVKSIHDGDTMRVIGDRHEEIKVRFACIDARELKQEGGKEDRDFVRKIVKENGNKVKLNITDKDRFGRSIAEIYVGDHERGSKADRLLQEIQVKNGKAFSYPQFKRNCPSWQKIDKAEQLAIASKIGLWSEKNVINPSEFRKQNKR